MQINQKNLFYIGLLLFFIINLLQAYYIEPHFDENYYWVYSRFPAWGYFDHPPMVAWLISAGNFLFEGYLGLRFMFVIISTVTFYMGWMLIRNYQSDPLFYWSLVFSVVMFIPYSFMALPDAALLLFSVQFLLVYRNFIQKNTIFYAILLGIIAAAMIYSKYHALLFLLLIFLSNPKLILNSKAWISVFITVLLLTPHIFWQIAHNFPTFRYHLYGRFRHDYSISFTLDFIINQLLLTGPFLGWLFLYAAASVKISGLFEKSIKFIFSGIFLFFLIYTFKGRLEPHWTLVAIFPMMILTAKWVIGYMKWKSIIIKTGMVTFAAGLLLRGFVIFYGDRCSIPFFKSYFNELSDKVNLQQHIGDYPVVFHDNYHTASAYAFANNRPYDTYLMSPGFSRITQYDYYPIEEQLQGKTIMFASRDSLFLPDDFSIVSGGKYNWYIKKINDFRSFNQLKVLILKEDISVTDNIITAKKIVLHNPYNRRLIFNDRPDTRLQFQCFVFIDKRWKKVDSVDLSTENLDPLETIHIENISFTIPSSFHHNKLLIYIGLSSGFYLPVHSGIRTTINLE